MNTHKKKTLSGVGWSVIDQGVRQFIGLGIGAVLARLLSPPEFGLVGMVTVAIGFLNVFRDFGLGASLIQKTTLSHDEINAVFWANVILGALIGLFIFVAAPLISSFYNQPPLLHLTQVMGFNFFLGSVGLVPDALIRKNIDFKAYFFRNLSTTIFAGVLAIVLAYYDFGYWALVYQSLFSTLGSVIIGFRMISWRPTLKWKVSVLAPFAKFSLPLLGENTINYWVRNVDNLLIGKTLGPAPLGIYSKAYSLMLLPVRQISGTLSRVMLPSFSLIKDDRQRVWNNYLKISTVIAFITFPLMAYLGIFAKEVIYIIYGPNWTEVVPIFKAFCILGALQSIGTLCGSVFVSQGKTLTLFRLGLFTKAFMILGIVGGLYLNGIMGVVYGYTVTSGLAFILESYFLARILEEKVVGMFRNLAPEVLSSLVLICSLYAANMLTAGLPSMVKLSIGFFAGMPVYLLALKLFKSSSINLLVNLYYERKKGILPPDAG